MKTTNTIRTEIATFEKSDRLQKRQRSDARRRFTALLRNVITSKRQLVESVSLIAKANRITLTALWELQRTATIYRGVISLGAIAAPVLGWWGSSRMISSLSGNGSLESGIAGTVAFTGGLAIAGIIPIALGSLERMSENCAFRHVFGKFTRKTVTFTQEQLSDPELAEAVKQSRERAVWRMMSMARGQSQLVRNIGMLTISGLTIAFKAPELIPVVTLFGLPSMASELRYARKRSALEAKLSPKWGGLWGDLALLMANPALGMLHLFGADRWFARRYRVGLDDASGEENDLESGAALERTGCSLVAGLGLALGVAWLFYRTKTNQMTVSDFVLLSGATAGISGCLSEFASLLGQQLTQAKSLNDFAEFLRYPKSEEVVMRQLPLEQEYASGMAEVPDTFGTEFSEHLCFKDVWLQYASAGMGQFAVRTMTFSVERGSFVAVVGRNGAGKSSSMALMTRQFLPTRGAILVNGVDITQMSKEEFARQVIMLPQKLQHFNLTVRELLNLGRSFEPAEESFLWQELERVGAREFVERWPDQLDTQLGVDRRRAVEPSGGQLQRLLLASVVIANRKLVILDEPVSMVDPEAARQFWDALYAERGARTVIFSTHHLGAVRLADKILFIDDGTLAAEGTHDELMATCDQYRNLFESQAADYR